MGIIIIQEKREEKESMEHTIKCVNHVFLFWGEGLNSKAHLVSGGGKPLLLSLIMVFIF